MMDTSKEIYFERMAFRESCPFLQQEPVDIVTIADKRVVLSWLPKNPSRQRLTQFLVELHPEISRNIHAIYERKGNMHILWHSRVTTGDLWLWNMGEEATMCDGDILQVFHYNRI